MRRLQLRKVEGHDIVIICVGGTKHCAILCEDVKITATLVKKGSGEIVLEQFKYLSPYVLIQGNINVIGPIEDAPMPKDTSEYVICNKNVSYAFA